LHEHEIDEDLLQHVVCFDFLAVWREVQGAWQLSIDRPHILEA
jgi:hypothetical protein